MRTSSASDWNWRWNIDKKTNWMEFVIRQSSQKIPEHFGPSGKKPLGQTDRQWPRWRRAFGSLQLSQWSGVPEHDWQSASHGTAKEKNEIKINNQLTKQPILQTNKLPDNQSNNYITNQKHKQNYSIRQQPIEYKKKKNLQIVAFLDTIQSWKSILECKCSPSSSP